MTSPHPERVVLAHHAAAIRHLKAVRDRREARHRAVAARIARTVETQPKPTEGKGEP